MQFEEVRDFIINKLETDLPSYLAYHNVNHTKKVIESAAYIGRKEGISDNEMLLLKTAALFHDTGFLQHHEDHERLSCKLARKYLPDYGYTDDQIEEITEMIMATRLPQAPASHLARILCDADLFYLGGDQYEQISDKLFHEFRRNQQVKTSAEWDIRQAEFLGSHQFFTDTANRELNDKKEQTLKALRNKLAKTLTAPKKSNPGEIAQDAILNIAGVIIASVALKFFLVPNQFFDGGITGMALLVHEIYHLDLSMLIVLFNLPLVILGYFILGRNFSLRILISIVLFGICLYFIPEAAMTTDKLLVAAFGGIFLGLGIGLVMRAGAALDGIEVLALYTLKRTSFTITEIILGINVLIFSVAAFVFGLETSMYSILTYFAATRTIDYVVEGIRAYTGVTIISAKSEAVKYEVVNNLGRAITVYKGERGFLPGNFEVSSDVDIIFTVITRMEMRKLKNLVYDIDPKAFVFASTIKDAAGGILRRRHAH